MILSGSRLLSAPIMGLQTGSQLAMTKRAIIDPGTLEVLAYEVEGPLIHEKPGLVRVADVREFSDIGLIIDSSDELITQGDVIKIDEIYKLGFELLAMPVVDEKHRKLGRINGYTIDTASFTIQQLSIKRPLLKSLNDTELLVHRSQISEINDKEIVIHSEAKIPEPKLESVRTAYVNPFRKPQASQVDTDES